MKALKWNIAMVGATGVGKTSLVRRYVEDVFTPDFRPTMGVQVTKRVVEIRSTEVTLVLWDLAGDDDFLWRKVPSTAASTQDERTSRADALILVADLTRRTTLEQAILRQERIALDKRSRYLPEVPFILALNKSDVSRKEFSEGDARGIVPGWRIVSTSAKTGASVAGMFEDVAVTLLDLSEEEE